VSVALESLQASFGPFSIDVTLAARPGEYMVILGPSGCGKSLLLGLVAGIHAAQQGRVMLDGRDVTHMPPEQRGVGFVFQKSSLFPHLGVEDNICFGLRVRGTPQKERRSRAAELVRSLGLTLLLERPTAALSGGEAQRVAIARALAPRPSVLLLDEPLSLVDHNARQDLQDELRRIHDETGLTVLHVTHNRDEARALGQRCAVMLGGRIIQAGTLEQVFGQPRCGFVARFLGADDAPAREQWACTERCLAGTGMCDGPSMGDR